MSSKKKSSLRSGIRVTHHRRDWMAGLHWEQQRSALLTRFRGKASPDTHVVVAGRRNASMMGVVSPGVCDGALTLLQ